VVANADRRLPLRDGSVRLVLSQHARRNPPECARVLAADGRLLIAVPAPDDLAELRGEVQGASVDRDRAGAVVAAHEQGFALADRFTVRERLRLDRAALDDLLSTTYRGARASAAPKRASLSAMDVTLASDVLLFAPR
jgi:23S rRNA (guanine745-N1)-methyltransferase